MSMEKCYPRVLIVNGQSIYANNATGITLRKLWQEWPKECLLEICKDENSGKLKELIDIEQKKLPKRLIDKLIHSHISQKLNNSIKPQSKFSQKSEGMLSTKQKIRQVCAILPSWFSLRTNAFLWKKIKTFKPDVIYTLGGSVAVLKLVCKISRKFNINTVIHFMDNWIEHNQWENNNWLKPYYSSMKKQARKCLKRSNIAITISPSMAKEYEKNLGIPCTVLMNMVDVKEKLSAENANNDEKKFVYAGGLHLERWKALLEIAKSIKENCKNGKLYVYTNKENKVLYEKNFVNLPVKFMPAVPHDQIEDVLKSASVLVHAEVSSTVLEGFFKHSISTKVPEYMATGRPFLFYAPKTMGVYQYLEENKAALVVGSREELDKIVVEIDNGKDYSDIISNAFNLAKTNHSSAIGWEILRSTMLEGKIKKN